MSTRAIKQLRWASVLTIIALALMVWSMLDPTPLPVMLAMSVGQLIGTAAFGFYGYVVWQDLRRIRRERRSSVLPIAVPSAADPVAVPPAAATTPAVSADPEEPK